MDRDLVGPLVHRDDVDLIIDTGGTGLLSLSQDMYTLLRNSLITQGAIPTPNPLVFINCFAQTSMLHALPVINILLGQDDPLIVRYSASQYLSFGIIPVGMCTLQATVGHVSDGILVGMETLSRLVTVFDSTNDRLGVCHRDMRIA